VRYFYEIQFFSSCVALQGSYLADKTRDFGSNPFKIYLEVITGGRPEFFIVIYRIKSIKLKICI